MFLEKYILCYKSSYRTVGVVISDPIKKALRFHHLAAYSSERLPVRVVVLRCEVPVGRLRPPKNSNVGDLDSLIAIVFALTIAIARNRAEDVFGTIRSERCCAISNHKTFPDLIKLQQRRAIMCNTVPKTTEFESASRRANIEWQNVTSHKNMSRSEWEQLIAEFLSAAGRDNNLEKVIECVEKDVDVETHISNGLRAIHLASYYGRLEIVKHLVEVCRADVDATSNDGWTALHLASQRGHLNVVQYLVDECNFDVLAKDNDGYIALHLASGRGYLSVVQYFVDNCRIERTTKSYNGGTALHLASRGGHLDVVEYIMRACKY